MLERRPGRPYKLLQRAVVRCLPVDAVSTALLHAKMRDTSTDGICFMCDQKPSIGARFDISFAIPLEVGYFTLVVLDANTRVVRMDMKPGGVGKSICNAASIEMCNIMRQGSAAP